MMLTIITLFNCSLVIVWLFCIKYVFNTHKLNRWLLEGNDLTNKFDRLMDAHRQTIDTRVLNLNRLSIKQKEKLKKDIDELLFDYSVLMSDKNKWYKRMPK